MTHTDIELLQQITKLNLFSSEEIRDFICRITRKDATNYYIDNLGNIVFSESRKIDTMIVFSFCPIGVMTDTIKENKVYVNAIGEIDKENLNGKETVMGVIRKEKELLYINCDKKDTEFPFILEVKSSLFCEDISLYSNNLKSYISLFLMIKLISGKSKRNNGMCFTLVNEGLSGKSGFIELAKRYRPKKVIMISVVKEHETCKSGKGPAVVIKDGNFVASPSFYSFLGNMAAEADISKQFFAGKTSSVLEKLSVSEKEIHCGAVYLPMKQTNNEMQKIIFEDVEKTLNLLLKCIAII